MKKSIFPKIIERVLMMVLVTIECLTFFSCNESGEEIHRVPAAPGDTIKTNTSTTYKVGAEMLDTVSHSGWLRGDAQLKGEGWIETLTAKSGEPDQVDRIIIGGRYVSDGVLTKDTIFCGTSFPEVVTFWVTDVENEEGNTTDSIGAKVIQAITGNDGQTGNIADFYRYLNVVLSSGGQVPHYEGSSEIYGVKYQVETDTTRRVGVVIKTSIRPKGTSNASLFDMYYTMWYVEKIREEVVTPPEPEVEKMSWNIVFELKENSVAKTLQATFNFTGNKGTTFSWKSNTGKVGFYASPNPFYVESVNPLPQEGNGADYEASLAKDKTTDKEIVMVTSHERCLLSKWKTTFRTGIADGEVFLRNDVNFYVTSMEFQFANGETFKFHFEPETILHDDQFITENLTPTLTGSDGKTYQYGKTLVQSATHKIKGTVTTPDGKTTPIVIDVLSDGETLYHNEGKVALYVMQ